MKNKLISITEITKQSWHLYVENLQFFLLPIAIMIIPLIGVMLLEYYNYFNIILFILVATLSIFISLWVSVLFTELIDKIHNKEKFNINELYHLAFQKIPSYLWVSFLSGLVIALGIFLFIIPFFIFAVWFAFAPYINVLENKNNKGWDALKNSKELVKGRWGKTFWRLLVPPLFVYVIVLIIIIGLTYAITGGNIDLNTPTSQANIVINSLSTLIFSFLSPLFMAFVIILYNNLKQTKASLAQKNEQEIPEPPLK